MKQKQLRELQDWAGHVTRGQRDSSVFLSLWSDAMLDPRKEPIPIFQLAYALLLDKPIVLVAQHGARIPENIKRVARTIEYYDRDDQASLHAATLRAMRVAGVEVPH